MFMIPRRFNQMFDIDEMMQPIARQMQAGGNLDVKEDEKQFTLQIDLPGYTQEELDVEVTDDNMVHIHAKREAEERKEGEKYLVQERVSREFTRAFMLPKDVQHTAVEASFENGVLRMVVPKAEKVVPQRAKVQFK